MKAIVDTLNVARSHLAERLSRSVRPRGPCRTIKDTTLKGYRCTGRGGPSSRRIRGRLRLRPGGGLSLG